MDELKCFSARCIAEPIWALKVRPRPCGHSWFNNSECPQTLLLCDGCMKNHANWWLHGHERECDDCSAVHNVTDNVIGLERL